MWHWPGHWGNFWFVFIACFYSDQSHRKTGHSLLLCSHSNEETSGIYRATRICCLACVTGPAYGAVSSSSTSNAALRPQRPCGQYIWDREPTTSTSIFTQLLSSGAGSPPPPPPHAPTPQGNVSHRAVI